MLLAAVTSGALAFGSFVVIQQYRDRMFVRHSEDAARLGLLSKPGQLSLEAFEELLDEFRARAGFETVALVGEVVYSSTSNLGPDEIPVELKEPLSPGELANATTTVRGTPYLVVAGVPAGGTSRLFFFFDRSDLLDSLRQFRNVLAIGWLAAVGGALLVGNCVARRTLRPVASAAEAAASLADGLLQTRLPAPTDDEFGAWAESFNRMAAALEEKIEALSDAAERERRFTADVAHELRTPLTGMSSAASMLADELDGIRPQGHRLAEILIDDVRRLEDLVLELLELARIDAGQDDVHLEPLSLTQAVGAVLATWDGDSPVGEATGPDIAVLADRVRFKRVLCNLVTNAVEHGGGQAEVVWRQEGAMVALDVLDRGPGLPDGHVERVFERFHKVDSSRTRRGAGLGLAIALEHARAQGGSLEAANREGGGARFTFRLPLSDPHGSESGPEAPASSPVSAPRS
ncbi:MAG TPA: HAMP domain-containing sensor histidine kinase [Acidimicrobiales bacterium]|nr:HAMP domain-containing sensor histidine kinase [Acidimicrobiales bacterium]